MLEHFSPNDFILPKSKDAKSISIDELLHQFPTAEFPPSFKPMDIDFSTKDWVNYYNAAQKNLADKYREMVADEYGLNQPTDEQVNNIIRVLHEQVACSKCQSDGKECEHACRSRMTRHISENGEISYTPCGKCANYDWQKNIDLHIAQSSIPQCFRYATFADYVKDNHNSNALRCATISINKGTGLYISGNCGTGKTMLASIVAQEYIRRGYSCAFVNLSSLMFKIFTLRTREAKDIERYYRQKVLVLDDLGAHSFRQERQELLLELLNERITRHNNLLIVTSNFTLPELAAQFTEKEAKRIVDRLRAMCIAVHITGDSRRKTKTL